MALQCEYINIKTMNQLYCVYRHSVLVCVLGHMLLLVRAPHSLTLCNVRLSSHLLLALLALTVCTVTTQLPAVCSVLCCPKLQVCLSSQTAIFSSLCGLV